MLSAGPFNAAMRWRGEQIAHYQARPCTCYDPATNYDEQQGCGECEHGHVYVFQANIDALIHSVKKEHLHPDFGLLQVGDLLISSVETDFPIATWDKIVLLDRSLLEWDRLIKGSRDTITNITQIASVVQVCQGELDYTEGTDWQFVSPNTIDWIDGGDAPDDEGLYAALVRYHPTYWYVGASRTGGRPAVGGNMPVQGRLVLRREET